MQGVKYTGSSESQTEPVTPQSVLFRTNPLPAPLNPAAAPFYPTHRDDVAHEVPGGALPAPAEQRPSVNKPQSHALVSRSDMSVRASHSAAVHMRKVMPLLSPGNAITIGGIA